MVGRRIGSWILGRELGRGGMGAVFEAHHVSLRTRAAVKVLSPGLETEESFRQRFRREADLQAQLRHPNIARVLDYLEDGGHWFLVVEYFERGSLAALLSHESVSRQQSFAWAQQALAGLSHAHHKGIIHRDIKPANLLLTDNGEVVVADFGIARAPGGASLTTTGIVVGTPQYMSPEQIVTPDRVDHRSDIYSLGIVLYELLAGRKPFDSGSQFAILQAHVSEPPPSLRAIDPTIPPGFEAVVMRALAKNAADRYPDCESMARDLDQSRNEPAAVPQIPSGGTIHASVLFDRVAIETTPRSSPGDARNQKRRSYKLRMTTGIAAVLFVATLLAVQLASNPTAEERAPFDTSDSSGVSNSSTTTIPNSRVHHDPIKPFKSSPPNTHTATRTLGPLPVPDTATATPIAPSPAPRSVPSLPEHPRIAVIGTGDDPLLASALELEMERRLDQFEVADEQGDPEVGELLQTKGAKISFQELGAALVKNDFQILVLLRVEQAESRKLTIRDIDGSVKAARMRLNAYLLPANRPMGRGWTEAAEYTELSAASTAKKAFIGPTADLRAVIESDWPQFRTAAQGAAR